jgi:hypothetical protein
MPAGHGDSDPNFRLQTSIFNIQYSPFPSLRLCGLLCLLLCLALSAGPAFSAAAPTAAEKRDLRAEAEAARKEAAEKEFARYAEAAISWVPVRGLKDVQAVFPHPVDPQRIVLATAGGLMIFDPAGTWRALPGGTSEKLGRVLDVAFRPDAPDTFYVATDERGLWLTEDAGKTFRQVGSKQSGLAGDSVQGVCLWPDDSRFQTIYATHGRKAAGISRSFDGGQTWTVVARDYNVDRLFTSLASGWQAPERILIAGRRAAEPQVQTLFLCSALEDMWSEILRDVVYADGTMSFSRQHIYVATADQGLLRVNATGAFPIGPAGAGGYASVGVTWGPRADKELLYAYEPKRLGLVTSLDGMASSATPGKGVYVGPFIKEGAQVRASANGGRFYAAVNGALQVGYVRTRGVSVADARVEPPVFTYERTTYEQAQNDLHEVVYKYRDAPTAVEFARRVLERAEEASKTYGGGELTITAKVTTPRGKPAGVTVDLSGLRGPPDARMFDDGKHGDGDANDGVYGLKFAIDPRNLLNPESRTLAPAGPHGLSIKALATEGGSIGGAVAVLAVFDRPDAMLFWSDRNYHNMKAESGDATVAAQVPREEALFGSRCLKFQTGEKPWSAVVGVPGYEGRDISGYIALSFWVRSDSAAELNVCLRDLPEFSEVTTSPAVAVVKDGLIEGGKLTGDWHRVMIPLPRLLAAAPGFRVGELGQIVLSGDGKPPATIWIDRVVFHPNAGTMENEKRPEAPGTVGTPKRKK